MIKSAIGWLLSYVLYGLGHWSYLLFDNLPERSPEWLHGCFFDLYQKLMAWSWHVQEWGNDKGPWRDPAEEDHIGDMYGDV